MIPALHQQPADDGPGAASEGGQRPRFRRHDVELEPFDGCPAGASGHHQGQLVDRERIDGPIGNEERNAARVLVLHVLDDALVHLAGVGVAEGEDVVEVDRQAASHGDQQRVVAQLVALTRLNDALGGLDRGEGVLDPLGS